MMTKTADYHCYKVINYTVWINTAVTASLKSEQLLLFDFAA